jgi:hypothetical protein
LRSRGLLIVAAVLGFGCTPAAAGWSDLIPRPVENGAYADIFASYEEDENTGDIRTFGWDDTFIREKVTVYSNGFFYDPRFLQYQLSLAGALKQESYSATFLESTGWRSTSGVEYDAKLLFLPQHPYNLTLFALRYEPLYKDQAAVQHNSVEERYGAYFQYRKKPWLAHSRYSVDSIRSTASWSDVTRFGTDVEYLKQYRNGNQFSLNGAYNPSWFTGSFGLSGSELEYLLGNMVDLRKLQLNSTVTGNRFDQESSTSGTYESDQRTWYEQLTAFMPGHLRGYATYRHQDSETRIPATLTSPERTLSDIGEDYRLDLVHRLYESLDTTYTFRDDSRTSSGGDTDSRLNQLAVNYTKTIPRGRVLAGVFRGRTDTDSEGRAEIVDEPHLATAVPGSFTLGQQNVDRGSIVIYLRSPLAPFNRIRLVENLHYAVTPVTGTFQIDILTLPPQFIVPGTYDFLASYVLETGSFTLRTDIYGFSTSVQLLEELLTPYYSYTAVRTDVVSGTFPGIPLDSSTTTAGLRYQRGPLRARGEYQRFTWEVSPYDSWRGEVQYVSSLTPTSSVYGIVTYLNKHFPQGTSDVPGEPTTDETTSLAGDYRKTLPAQGMSFSAGGSYSRLRGRVETDAYSLNSSLSWKVGKLDLSAGASIYTADTTGTTNLSNDRFHQYYYIMLRRVLY